MLLPLVFLGLTACKKCDDPTGIAIKISDKVTDSWQCKNAKLVEADIQKWLASKGMCEPVGPQKTGMVAMVACPIVAEVLRRAVASKVPKAWECDESLIGVNAAMGFSTICNLIPF